MVATAAADARRTAASADSTASIWITASCTPRHREEGSQVTSERGRESTGHGGALAVIAAQTSYAHLHSGELYTAHTILEAHI